MMPNRVSPLPCYNWKSAMRYAVDAGHAYRTPAGAPRLSISLASLQERQGFLNSHSCGSHFFRLLMDGTGNVEVELTAMC